MFINITVVWNELQDGGEKGGKGRLMKRPLQECKCKMRVASPRVEQGRAAIGNQIPDASAGRAAMTGWWKECRE